jgi:release factor glutamine methyltransferase
VTGAPRTWRMALLDASARLGSADEARVLLEEAAAARFSELFVVLDAAMPPGAEDRLSVLVARRTGGEPLQHVVGHWPFRSLDVRSDRRALVPRPETEFVVEVALAELRGLAPTPRPPVVADLGTGSGVIACAIASEHPRAVVIGIDRSPTALELASENRSLLPVEVAARITFVEGDWYGPLRVPGGEPITADLIVANPPYLSEEEWGGLDPVVKDFDPVAALVAGPSGLEDLAVVITGAPEHLAPGGALVCEIGAAQGDAVTRLAAATGARHLEVRVDLAGRDRVLVARW